MHGLKVGHYTNSKQGTGASVFLFDKPAIGAFHLAGSSPATFDLSVLDLAANVTHVDGLALLGGSASGLPAVAGAQQWLSEHDKGWLVPHGRVPLLPAAAIYDLGFQTSHVPTASNVYEACESAIQDNCESGSVGAGTGATVGKIVPHTKPMKGGVGFQEIVLSPEVSVLVYAVVNCVGDVCNTTGKIIAGARLANGDFVDSQQYLLSGQEEKRINNSNTTLIAVFTNAKFSKIELNRIAKMAVSGMSRAILPVFTRYDGDIAFCFSVGKSHANELTVGAAAAEAARQAIINAVAKE